MGVSGPVAFAVLLIATLVSFGMLYSSGENAYFMIHEAGADYNSMVLKTKTAELALVGYNYTTQSSVLVYDITFNVTNRGCTLEPGKWAFLYNGEIDNSSVLLNAGKYLLPGQQFNITVQNVPKVANETQSLVISTEVGCGLKIQWEWVGNSTNGSPRVTGSAWYCPGEG